MYDLKLVFRLWRVWNPCDWIVVHFAPIVYTFDLVWLSLAFPYSLACTIYTSFAEYESLQVSGVSRMRDAIVIDRCLIEAYTMAGVITNHASLNFQWQWKLSDTRFWVGCHCILIRSCTSFLQVVDIHCQWAGGRGGAVKVGIINPICGTISVWQSIWLHIG